MAAAAAGIDDLVTLLAAAVPVMAEGGNIFLDDLSADAALVFGAAGIQAGGRHHAVADLHKLVFMGVRLEMGGQHHAAGVGVRRHGILDGGAAVAAAGAGCPSGKDKPLLGHGGHGAGGAALLDQLAGGPGQGTAVGGHEFHRHFGAPHGDGILGDQVGGHTVGGGDGAQRLGTAVLRHIGVGAHIVEIGSDRRLGQMHAVRKGVVGFGPAGGAVPQDLGTVQELEAVFFAHGDQGRVVGIHLGHGEVGVFPLLVQRRNGADDDVTVGPGGLDCLQTL